MKDHVKRTLVSVSLVALATGLATPVSAVAGGSSGLRPMPVNGPALAEGVQGWQGHWAEQDLEILLASANIQPEALVNSTFGPDDAMPIRMVADLLTHMYGAGGEQGDALDRAIGLGLIRLSDFGGEKPDPDQTVSRELLALLMTRALGVKGAEDPVVGQTAPHFADAAEIQLPYRAAVNVLQAEGLLTGDGGRFCPADPVTFAQAARTLLNVSRWSHQRAAKISGLNPADATYLIGGQTVTLSGGLAEQPTAPGSATKAVTKLSDRLAAGDLNGDGQIDVAAVLTHDGGGSGTFYYLAAVQHDGTPVEAAFLGDRIAVQNVRFVNGKVAVDLLIRGAEAPMATRPYIKETRIFEAKDGRLVPLDSSAAQVAIPAGLNPADATYLIGGQTVTLSGGLAEQPTAPGSATKAVTKLSDRLAAGDLNGDGQIDVAAVLTHDGGGSGTFYYLAAVQHDGTPVEAAFLGDRIAVQSVRFVDGKVAVDLLIRGAEDPMAVSPSSRETRMFEVKDGALVRLGE